MDGLAPRSDVKGKPWHLFSPLPWRCVMVNAETIIALHRVNDVCREKEYTVLHDQEQKRL